MGKESKKAGGDDVFFFAILFSLFTGSFWQLLVTCYDPLAALHSSWFRAAPA